MYESADQGVEMDTDTRYRCEHADQCQWSTRNVLLCVYAYIRKERGQNKGERKSKHTDC